MPELELLLGEPGRNLNLIHYKALGRRPAEVGTGGTSGHKRRHGACQGPSWAFGVAPHLKAAR
jgi:hypothetical protein